MSMLKNVDTNIISIHHTHMEVAFLLEEGPGVPLSHPDSNVWIHHL